MAFRWCDLDPRWWSRGLRALTVLLAAAFAAVAWAAPRALARWEAYRADARFDAVTLPRVASDLSPLYPAARVRVTADGVDLDLRARTAALPDDLRRLAWNATEPLWREALLVESRGLVRLHHGRLRDEDERRRATYALADRWAMVRSTLADVPLDRLDYLSREVPILFVDARVPVATWRDVLWGLATGSALALRGPRGMTLLPFPNRTCTPVPSVEVAVSAARFVVRSTPERGGCTAGPGALRRRESVIARDGADRGLGPLRETLAGAPWTLAAEGGYARRTPAEREAPGPWGTIRLELDEDLPIADLVATAMVARERAPGRCDEYTRREGCLFPVLVVDVVSRNRSPRSTLRIQ